MPGAVNVKIAWSRAGGGATAPTITSPAFLVAGTVNTVYPSTTFTASGTAPITWTVTSGTLPTGMSFSTAGVLSGTPTATASGSITFTATNAQGADSRALTLTVNAAGSFATPSNILPPTIETVISGATINQVGTMLRVKRGGWPATDSWTLDWRDPAAAYANPGISITNGSTANPVKFALARRYQWLRNGVAIPSENNIAYTLTSADVGQTVSVRETVNRIVPNASNTAFVESTSTASVNSTQTITSISGTQAAALVYKNNLTYLGSFRVHNSYFDSPSVINESYAQAIAFDASGNGGAGSIFILSSINRNTCEINIPTSFADGFATAYASLPEASIIQSAVNVSGWTAGYDFTGIYGQLIYNGNLIQSGGQVYTPAAPLITHSKRSKSLSATVTTVTSLVTPSGGYGNGRYLSGPMCLIPSAWQTALGGKALTGWAGISVNGNSNKGPPAYAFDPDLIGTGNVTAQTLLHYSNSLPLDAESQNPLDGEDAKGSQAPLWNSTSFGYGVYGMTIPNGTDSLLYFGLNPVGVQGYSDTAGYEVDNVDAYYGSGTRNAFDLFQQTRSPYCGTYAIQCWAYDLNALASVKSGSTLPYNVKPYAVWSISLPYNTASSTNSDAIPNKSPIAGAIYDSINKRIYIGHRFPSSGESLVFSAFSVSNAS